MGNALNYLFYYCLIIPLSLLPHRVLYFLSDVMYLVVYRVVGYRKEVIYTNLRNSFPEKTEDELREIMRKYYHHMCDLVVESLKNFTISKKEADKRMTPRNAELPNSYFEKGKSLVFIGGHYGNWELYGVAVPLTIKHKMLALFTPLKNKFFDEKIRKSRSKFGLLMLSSEEIREQLELHKDQLTATIFASDQSPRKGQRAYWTTFLNQETGVQFGAEKFARQYNMAVITGGIFKVRRGYYEVHYQLICENPSELPEGEIMERFTRVQEDIIKKQPEYWLWSHKRWKYKKPLEE